MELGARNNQARTGAKCRMAKAKKTVSFRQADRKTSRNTTPARNFPASSDSKTTPQSIASNASTTAGA